MFGFLMTAQPSASEFNPLWILVAIAVASALITGGIWIGKVQIRTSALNDLMPEVRDGIKELLQRLPPRPVAGGSPLQLTDLGRDISQQIGADVWAWDKAEELAQHIKGFAAEFEFHAFADDYVRNKFDPSDEFRRKMEACAYQNGISTDQVKEVLVVVLRDILLALNAGEARAEE